ncbi:MAG: 2-hydroxyacid dehydrogenase, partial [Alphaproteobacteria bacterium]|nr:2-hydroxyacid dehydrogenase [Alphaproteobacteria bacterium]
MRTTVFSTKPYDATYLRKAGQGLHDLAFFDLRLTRETAPLAAGSEAVCAFVNDDLGAETLTALANAGVKLVALR